MNLNQTLEQLIDELARAIAREVLGELRRVPNIHVNMGPPSRHVVLQTSQVAERLGVSIKTLNNWRVSGQGPRFLKVGARVVYDATDVEQFMDASKRISTSDSGSRLIRLTDVQELKAAGLPWATEQSARWAYRKRHENGLAGAFVRIGKNVHVDPAKVHEQARRT